MRPDRGASHRLPRWFGRGFTLLELMVVVFILGIVSVGVSLALPDPAQQQLQQESRRLVALLEAARAESRSSGTPIRALPGPDGLRLQRPGQTEELLPWLQKGTQAQLLDYPATTTLVLGPEPLIAPQRIRLWHANQSLLLATDGIGPFQQVEGPVAP